jgi:uncharacterized repeat protein (TIGR03803 family)
MTNTVRHNNENRNPGHGRAAEIALAFVAVLGFGAATTHLAQAQVYQERVLYTFTAGTDGANPEAGLIMDAKGSLYGTTSTNGGMYNGGTVFKVSSKGSKSKETVLYNFEQSKYGGDPQAGLIMDAKGNLYGNTYFGGDTNHGVVFEFSPPTKKGDKWTETVLYSFCPKGIGTCTDGERPYAGLMMDAKGNLYGTTYQGGSYNAGTVFELTP